MKYRDILYGEWELPDIVAEICTTREMVRLRGITQGVLPYGLDPVATMPNRFEHGLGVSRLAQIVLESNRGLRREYGNLLIASALLHDAGNPPFAHLSEHFLHELTGDDGESFLCTLLDCSETEYVLKKYGLSLELVVAMVTGKAQPISTVLNGSVDIDNLDNIMRFNVSTQIDVPFFEPATIASGFHLNGEEWQLSISYQRFVKRWQTARRIVYGKIYSEEHLRVATMIYRAMELAYRYYISEDFFSLDDAGALEKLAQIKNGDGTWILIDRARRWQWHETAANICYKVDPPPRLVELASHWRGRMTLADVICDEFHLTPWMITVYAGVGRDVRKITIPFISHYGDKIYDADESAPVYRALVFCAPELSEKKKAIGEFVSSYINS